MSWICSCTNGNSGGAKKCSHCGRPRAEAQAFSSQDLDLKAVVARLDEMERKERRQ